MSNTDEVGMAKINLRVSRDLHTELLATVPWGLRRHLVEALLRLVLQAIRKEGPIMVGALLAGEFKLVRDENAPQGGFRNSNEVSGEPVN